MIRRRERNRKLYQNILVHSLMLYRETLGFLNLNPIDSALVLPVKVKDPCALSLVSYKA